MLCSLQIAALISLLILRFSLVKFLQIPAQTILARQLHGSNWGSRLQLLRTYRLLLVIESRRVTFFFEGQRGESIPT